MNIFLLELQIHFEFAPHTFISFDNLRFLHLHSGLYVISYYFWTRNLKQVTYTKRVM